MRVNYRAIANRDCHEYGCHFHKGDIVQIVDIDGGVCDYIDPSDQWSRRHTVYLRYFDIIYSDNAKIIDKNAIIQCPCCGDTIKNRIIYIGLDGKEYCSNCFFEKYAYCDKCKNIVEKEKIKRLGRYNKNVCYQCLEIHFVKCNDCNDFFYKEETYAYSNKTICYRCANNYYQCETCRCAVLQTVAIVKCEEDGWSHAYCSETCYELRPYKIKSYSYKPSPNFKRCHNENPNNLYMGIELEVDKGGEDNQKAGVLANILSRDFVYCKHDGSLKNGFEIVTQPATFKYHLSQKHKYSEAFQYLIKEGYRSHTGGTCGFHIHVNKDYFGFGDEQEANIAKVLYVFEKFWDKFIVLSRRTRRQLNRWAARYCFQTNVDYKTNVYMAKNKGRYMAVNLANDNTIEFRMFRGTLNIESFLAIIQLIYTICEKCKNTPIDQIQTMTFDDFIKTDYKELNNYMKRRWEKKRELESVKRAKLIA